MNLENRIFLPSLKIVEETADGFRVMYKEEEIYIAKAGESTFFSTNGLSPNMSCHQQLSLTPRLDFITQDEDVPREFISPMIYHELREKEYAEAGLDNTHERALNDELLFVLKNFDADFRVKYFEFADNYRMKALKKREEEEEIKLEKEEFQKKQKRLEDCSADGYFNIYSGIRFVDSFCKIITCTNEETADRVNKITEKPSKAVPENLRIISYGGGDCKENWLNYVKKLRPDVILTGSTKLSDYLASNNVNSNLYNALKDAEPFDNLKKLLWEGLR